VGGGTIVPHLGTGILPQLPLKLHYSGPPQVFKRLLRSQQIVHQFRVVLIPRKAPLLIQYEIPGPSGNLNRFFSLPGSTPVVKFWECNSRTRLHNPKTKTIKIRPENLLVNEGVLRGKSRKDAELIPRLRQVSSVGKPLSCYFMSAMTGSSATQDFFMVYVSFLAADST
jgi:hypothetical protein